MSLGNIEGDYLREMKYSFGALDDEHENFYVLYYNSDAQKYVVTLDTGDEEIVKAKFDKFSSLIKWFGIELESFVNEYFHQECKHSDEFSGVVVQIHKVANDIEIEIDR